MDDQKKILIVDDVEANRFVLRNKIGRASCRERV